jgi:hypothetical protein
MLLGQSRLLLGLLHETNDAIAAQVELWDRSTILQTAWDQASKTTAGKKAETALHDLISRPLVGQLRSKVYDYVPQQLNGVAPQLAEDPLDGHVKKFCRLLHHAGLRLERAPTVVELHDLCLQIERDAVKALASADERSMMARLKREPKRGFEGTTTDDLVRYVIQKTFDQLDADFAKKTPAEQEAIAERIAKALSDLPPEEQERIRTAARLPDLTAETLRQTGTFASLGIGLSTVVGVAGFTAYTTLTSTVATVVAVFTTAHLPFAAYTTMTWGLAGLANPLFFIPVVLGGGTWMARRANRSIRGVLYPTFVATSVMSDLAVDDHELPSAAFASRIGTLIREINTVSGHQLLSLVGDFPALGPSFSARLVSHVTT